MGLNILITMSGLQTLMAPNTCQEGSWGVCFYLLRIRGIIFRITMRDMCPVVGWTYGGMGNINA